LPVAFQIAFFNAANFRSTAASLTGVASASASRRSRSAFASRSSAHERGGRPCASAARSSSASSFLRSRLSSLSSASARLNAGTHVRRLRADSRLKEHIDDAALLDAEELTLLVTFELQLLARLSLGGELLGHGGVFREEVGPQCIAERRVAG
jgi:hypothetical protein